MLKLCLAKCKVLAPLRPAAKSEFASAAARNGGLPKRYVSCPTGRVLVRLSTDTRAGSVSSLKERIFGEKTASVLTAPARELVLHRCSGKATEGTNT